MSFDPNYKATLMILNDIESQGLIHFNKEYHDEDFFRNFIQFRKAFSHSMSELISKLETFQTKQEEMNMFTTYSELSYINSQLDAIKKFLKIIINPIKLEDGFDKDSTLEHMVKRICKKMNYSEKMQNAINGLFLLDFKNAITQQQYRIHESGEMVIYPNDKKMKKYLNIKDLADNSKQAAEILDAMFDWSNGKVRTEYEKPEILDDIVSDFTKQVQELDKKLDNLS
ncbi:hypothetical protein [Candidatus Nitrosopumilus sediminis]|uniref:Uncharacterized protein n=1 Tax=Candidatus Nitrosopumilus sediminis TaxID=1229909 RepID=K0BCS6_9ARCH|nr:hypothetical protein [Candidatus Nitrosopumilus sediminis]AFS82820.1 hypothetical protein NSED_05080 [Candidatus Nitrosopumilus sediminis]